MPLDFADRVKETTTTTGTGSLTLAGAATGSQTFLSGVGNNATCQFTTEDGTDWEVAEGTLTGNTTLSRDRILDSSNSGSAVNWGAGSKDVFLTISGERAKRYDDTVTLAVVNSFEIASQNNLTDGGLGDAWYRDVFTDQTGINATDSTNEVYNSTNDFYSGAGGETLVTGGTNIGNMTNGGGLAAAFDGNTSQSNTQGAKSATGANASGTVGKQHASAKTATRFVATASNDVGFGGLNPSAESVTWEFRGSNDAPNFSSVYTTLLSGTENETSDTGTVLDTDVIGGLNTTTAYDVHYLFLQTSFGGGTAYVCCAELQIYEELSNNMTLVSEAGLVTTSTAPTDLVEYILVEPVDAANFTVGTNVTVRHSRDGGTTWSNSTESSLGEVDGKVIVVAETDVSGQPSGTDPRVEINIIGDADKVHARKMSGLA